MFFGVPLVWNVVALCKKNYQFSCNFFKILLAPFSVCVLRVYARCVDYAQCNGNSLSHLDGLRDCSVQIRSVAIGCSNSSVSYSHCSSNDAGPWMYTCTRVSRVISLMGFTSALYVYWFTAASIQLALENPLNSVDVMTNFLSAKKIHSNPFGGGIWWTHFYNFSLFSPPVI